MELLFNPQDVLSYDQLMQWDKNDLAEYILYSTYIKYPEDSYDQDELPMDKLIAKI